MTDILMSIRPEWVELICKKVAEENGKPVYKKRIEVRKTKPSRELPVRVLIYCTKHKEKLIEVVKKGDYLGWGCIYKEEKPMFIKTFADSAMMGYSGIGKVIGEFVCYRIDEYKYRLTTYEETPYKGKYISKEELAKTCLSIGEINDYLNGKNGYLWHISDLKIYDKPKELSEFGNLCRKDCLRLGKGKSCEFLSMDGTPCNRIIPITRPPQSWCYVERCENERK